MKPAAAFLALTLAAPGLLRAQEARGDAVADFLSRRLDLMPGADALPDITKELAERESRFLLRLRDRMASGTAAPSWVLREQRALVGKSLTASFVSRYRLDVLARRLQDPAALRDADPALVAAGAALLYINGLHARHGFGDWRVAVDVAPAHRLRRALETGAAFPQAAGMDVMRGGLALRLDWSLRQGRWKRELYGVKYQRRF